MGVHLRMKKLQDAAQPERQKAIGDAANRLVDTAGMGKQYKVLGLSGAGVGVAQDPQSSFWPFVDASEGSSASS
jgi:NADH dehydrogenase [ubiquinone] 1 alpha subcomplex assembly factor 7